MKRGDDGIGHILCVQPVPLIQGGQGHPVIDFLVGAEGEDLDGVGLDAGRDSLSPSAQELPIFQGCHQTVVPVQCLQGGQVGM